MARPIYVPQAGGFIEFSDDATDAEIVSYLKAKFPAPPPVAAAPPPAAAGPDDSGIASRFAYGLATGLTDIPGGIAALMDPAKEAGETVGGRFSEGARQYLQETLGIDPTKEATTAQTLAQGVGSLGSFLIPGIGAAKGAGLLGAGARLAGSAAVATGAAQGVAVGAEQRAQRIRDQLESGMNISEEDQLAAQRLSGLIGASEALPLGRFFKPLNILLSKIPASKAPIVEQIVKNRLSRIASAGIAEGAQEAASGIANDLMEYGVYNPNVEIGQDLLSNAGTGAFAGSFLEGVIQLAAGRKLRASRQLAEDLEREAIANQAIVDQGELVRAAEELRQYNVEGPVTIGEADIEGMTGYTIKAPSGNMFGAFTTPEQAQQAIDIYKQRTGAKITATVEEASEAETEDTVEADTPKVGDILPDGTEVKSVTKTKIGDKTELKINGKPIEDTSPELTEEDFAPVQEREAIPEEMPIGAIEMPIEEQRYIEPAAPIETPIEAEPPKKELRPSATDEQLTDLKAELFGTPKNIRDMTPEERALYESERDKRYPPVEVDVSYDAGMLKTPKTLTEVEQRSDARKYTPEYQAFMDGVYTELSSRLSNIAPESVSLRLRDFVAGSEGRLTRGTETPTRTPDGLKSVIELATGYVRPGVTVEEMVNELVGTLNHEVIHALRTQGLLRPAEWQILSRAAAKTKVPGKKYTYLDKAQAIYEPMGGIYTTEDAVIEEAVAEMYKDWVARKNTKEAVPVAGLFNRITEFLRRIFRTLQNRKYEDVFKQISAGEMRAREGAPESRREGQRFSAAPALNSEEFKRWFKNSKVVNPDGTPRVVYHGTDAKKIFDVFGVPSFFTTDPEEASAYTFTSVLARRDKAISKPKYRVVSGSAGISVDRVPYIGIIDDISIEDRGKVYATDNGVVRVNKDGSVDLFSDWVVDYETASLDGESVGIKRGDGSAVKDIVKEYKDLIDKTFPEGAGETGRVYPVYLNIKNPKEVSPLEANRLGARLNSMTPDEVRSYIEALEAQGYDGIVTLSDEGVMFPQAFKGKKPPEQFIPFRQEQVKSIFNQFEDGAAEDTRFAAAPLPQNVAQANTTLFAPEPKEGFFQSMAQYFAGPGPQPKTLNTAYGQVDISKRKMQRVGARASAVDKNAFIAELEKLANLKSTGNYERMLADYSATAALGWRRRSSHINASMLQRGKLTLDYARPGDIQSATMKVVDDPDSMANIIKILMEPGPVDPVTNEQKDKREVFKSYAVAMRAKNKALLGIKTPNEVDQNYVNTVIPFTQQNYPEVVQAYEMYQRFNRNLLKTAKEAGLITDTELQNLTRNMDYYGFYREVFENVAAPGMPTKTASKFELRAMKGGEHGNLVGDPIYVMIHNAQFWVESIAKNIAAQKSFKLAKDMGVARILGSTEKPDQARGEEEQVMFFRENGIQKRFAVSDPLLVMALGTDDRVDIGRFWQLAGMPTTVLRESVTRDPGFMVANLMRDTLSAWITSGEDITPFIGTVKGFAKAYKKDTSFQALMGRGVVGSYDLAMKAPKELAADLRNRAMPKNVLTLNGPEAATAVIGGLWNRLGALSEYSDAATRIAVYEAARAQGLSEAEATFRSIEIMDFSRRGGSQALSILTKVVPFLNARIQGMDVLYQAGKAAKKVVLGQAQGEREANLGKKFLVRGAMLAAISVALEMMNDDDEDYQQLDDYIKTGNLLIPLKYFGLEGQFLAIPKPFEAGLLFSTFPQEFYKSMSGDASTRSMVNLFISSVGSTFGVNPIPQALLPGLEIITNHDFYTGLPLISEGKARLAPELQYNSGTSQLAMMLGEIPIWYDMTSGRFEGLSPIVIDNLIGGYAGPWGTYIAQAVGMAMEGFDVGPERLPRDITQLPVVRRFFMDAQVKNPKVVTQAYELFRLVDEANRSFSRLRQTGDAEAVMDYLEENKDVLSYKKYVFKLVDRLNKLSAHERQIERDQTMTREEKLEAMAKLREVRIRLASKVKEINAVLGR